MLVSGRIGVIEQFDSDVDAVRILRGTVATGHHLPSPNAAELMMDWPG